MKKKNKKNKKLYIGAAVALVVVGGAIYWGQGTQFQGLFQQNLQTPVSDVGDYSDLIDDFNIPDPIGDQDQVDVDEPAINYTDTVIIQDIGTYLGGNSTYFTGKIDHPLLKLEMKVDSSVPSIEVRGFQLLLESTSENSALFSDDLEQKLWSIRMLQDQHPTDGNPLMTIVGNPKNLSLNDCGVEDCFNDNLIHFKKKLHLFGGGVSGFRNVVHFLADFTSVELGDSFTLTFDPSTLIFIDPNTGKTLDTDDVLVNSELIVLTFRAQ